MFIKWVQASINKQIKEVSIVATVFIDHLSRVVNTLITNKCNGEWLNGKIQELKIADIGYRTFDKLFYYFYIC